MDHPMPRALPSLCHWRTTQKDAPMRNCISLCFGCEGSQLAEVPNFEHQKAKSRYRLVPRHMFGGQSAGPQRSFTSSRQVAQDTTSYRCLSCFRLLSSLAATVAIPFFWRTRRVFVCDGSHLNLRSTAVPGPRSSLSIGLESIVCTAMSNIEPYTSGISRQVSLWCFFMGCGCTKGWRFYLFVRPSPSSAWRDDRRPSRGSLDACLARLRMARDRRHA